jgi:hypothetical protein
MPGLSFLDFSAEISLIRAVNETSCKPGLFSNLTDGIDTKAGLTEARELKDSMHRITDNSIFIIKHLQYLILRSIKKIAYFPPVKILKKMTNNLITFSVKSLILYA